MFSRIFSRIFFPIIFLSLTTWKKLLIGSKQFFYSQFDSWKRNHNKYSLKKFVDSEFEIGENYLMNSLLTSNPITVAAAEWYLPWSRLSMSFRILAMVPKKLQKRSERLHSLSSAIRQRSGGGQSTNTLCLASIKAKLYIPSSIKTMLIFWHTKWPILTQKSTLFKSQIFSLLC